MLRAAAAESQWIEVTSPHFSVITDAGERRGRDVAVRFEQMRSVFGTLMTKANVNIPVPLQIVAFRNSKEFRQVAPLWHGKPTQDAGLFQPGQDRSFIMLDMSVENPWSVVFHEYAHQLMNGNVSAELDPWFDEGFAEYFSTIEVDGKQAKVGEDSRLRLSNTPAARDFKSRRPAPRATQLRNLQRKRRPPDRVLRGIGHGRALPVRQQPRCEVGHLFHLEGRQRHGN